jgi:hypothetical protein
LDPDLVRQQEEAERESLTPKKPAAVPVQLHVVRAQEAEILEDIRAREGAPAEELKPAFASEPPLREVPAPSTWTSAAALAVSSVLKLVQYALAGGIFGGAMGIAAANYFKLAAEAAQIAFFAPAGFMALLCGLTSLRTRK